MSVTVHGAQVRIESMQKRFGNTLAVDGVSLTVEPGELLILLGPSGCGKTTVLRSIAGLETPDAGKILIGGRDVTHLPTHQRDVCMVFQSYALFPHLTVFENIAYGLKIMKKSREQIAAEVEEVMAMAGLSKFASRNPSQLSGGQQQRVALARALVIKPRVLLFDEPLSNLDAKLRKQMRDDIRALQKKVGTTAVYVTHDQSEALAIADRIVIMDHGKIVQAGGPHDLYQRPASRFVAEFVGEANFVKGRLKRATPGGEGEVELGPISVLAGVPSDFYGQPGHEPGAEVDVMIRPEALHRGSGANTLKSKVLKSTYLGASHEYQLETPVGRLQWLDLSTKHAPLHEGDHVELELSQRGVFLVGA